jgi:hypothetical protein
MKTINQGIIRYSFILFALSGTLMIFYRGSVHDYVAYEIQWNLILIGRSSEAQDNVYGPLHYIFAYLWSIHDLGPKFLWFLLLTVALYPLFRKAKELTEFRKKAVFLVLVPFNFLTLSISSSLGLNDTLVAALVLIGITQFYKDRFVFSGFLLGLSVLVKFYPIILIFFLGVKNRKIQIRFLSAALCTILVGFISGFILWQDSVFRLFDFGTNRSPKYFNILGSFFYINDRSYPRYLEALLNLNLLLVILVSCSLFVLFLVKQLNSLSMGFITLFVFLILYKGSAEQYFLPWLLIWGFMTLSQCKVHQKVAKATTPFVIFLSGFALGYELFGGYFQRGQYMREYTGIFTLLLGFVLSIQMLKLVIRENKLVIRDII